MMNIEKHISPVVNIAKNSKKIVGGIIKSIREEKKITQTQLAHLLDIDRQYVWRLENGFINLTMDYLDKIIVALGCVPTEFFNLYV